MGPGQKPPDSGSQQSGQGLQEEDQPGSCSSVTQHCLSLQEDRRRTAACSDLPRAAWIGCASLSSTPPPAFLVSWVAAWLPLRQDLSPCRSVPSLSPSQSPAGYERRRGGGGSFRGQ